MEKDILCEIVKFKKNWPVWIFHHTGYSSKPVPSHWHRDIELNILNDADGWIDFYIDGRHEILNSGGVCLINSGEVHSSVPTIKKVGDKIVGFTIIISYTFLKNMIPDIDQFYWRVEKLGDQKIIKDLVNEMSRVYQAEKEEMLLNIRLISLMCQLMSYLCENCMYRVTEVYTENQRNSERIRKILDYIHEHYQYPLTQEAVAQKFFLSRGYFSAYFKKYTGKTFKVYLTEIRLLHAEQMLKQSGCSISQIAQDAGFSDERRFIETFKKYYQLTPGAFRKTQE